MLFYSPKALLLHLKRFIFVEKPLVSLRPSAGDENQTPNSPSQNEIAPPVEYVFQKKKTSVRLSESLSLDAFQASGEEQGISPSDTTDKYHLKSIVHHIGRRASSGHYTADAIRPVDAKILQAVAAANDGVTAQQADAGASLTSDAPTEVKDCWVTFDDGSTYITSLEKIQSRMDKQATAYMLLYALEPGKTSTE